MFGGVARVIVLLSFMQVAPEVTAQSLPREVTVNGVDFVLVPAGDFTHTIPVGDPHAPSFSGTFRNVRVWLPDFYIAKYESRVGDFLRFMNSGAVSMPKRFSADGTPMDDIVCSLERLEDGLWRLGDLYAENPGLPATSLSWDLASAFASWMGFRLPTEAEWTKAARGSEDSRLWPWGNGYPDDTHANFERPGSPCSPSPVTAFPKGASPYGTLNLAGNAGEWVQDWWNPDFDSGLEDGARSPVSSLPALRPGDNALPRKILKGGRWGGGADMMAIPWRHEGVPSTYFNAHDGVRFALDADGLRARLGTDSGKLPEKELQ